MLHASDGLKTCFHLAIQVSSAENEEVMYTAFTVTVDAREGISTGISAADRARTLRMLADPATQPADLRKPGHICPLRYAPPTVILPQSGRYICGERMVLGPSVLLKSRERDSLIRQRRRAVGPWTAVDESAHCKYWARPELCCHSDCTAM